MSSTSANIEKTPKQTSRFGWLPPVLVASSTLFMIWLAATASLERDYKNLIGFSVVAGTLLVLLGWFSFCSTASARVRFGTLGVAATAVALYFAMFRIKEFDGNVTPTIVSRTWLSNLLGIEQAIEAAPTVEVASDDDSASKNAGADVAAQLPRPNDYSQFLGPARTGEALGVTLDHDWKAKPPKLLWKKKIGAGWSGFAVAGDWAVTQEQHANEQFVVCCEVTTGKVRWTHKDPGLFSEALGGDGPRATPTIHEGKVYVQQPLGQLVCLDLQSGAVIWMHDILAENGATLLTWGMSGSPLIVDDLVIVRAGGQPDRSLLAYNKNSGELVWHAGADIASYASPVLTTFGDVRQIVCVVENYVVAQALDDGRELWRHPWPGSSSSNASCSQPVILSGERVFLSKGYNIGAELLQIARDSNGVFSVTSIWNKPDLMRTKFCNVVVRDGHAYGLSMGILECVDLAAGERDWKYKGGRFGHGQILLAGEDIVVLTEQGEVALVRATPEQFEKLGEFQAIEGKTWNTPALSGPYLLVRNHEEAACYELPIVAHSNAAEPDSKERPAQEVEPAPTAKPAP